MNEIEKTLNGTEYIEEILKQVTEKIAELLLEGDAYFSEWEMISKLLYECNRFLEFMNKKKEQWQKWQKQKKMI